MKVKPLTKFSLLSISVLLMSHLAISPVLPKLYDYYHAMNPNLGLATVESLATIPAMMITIFVLLSNIVIRWIGKKNTVLLGIFLILVFGNLPAFVPDFKWVFVSRMLLGAGIGLFNSLSVSLMSDFFEGSQKATMIGMRTAFLNVGKAITTFISGYLLVFGAQYIFLSYLIAAPILLLFYFFVPEVDAKKTQDVRVYFDRHVLVLMVLTFVVGLCYMGLTIKIPSLVLEVYQLDVSVSRNLLTILALSGTIAGFVFGWLLQRIKAFTLTVMLGLMAIGSLIFSVTQSLVLFYVAAILIGISFVGTMSFVFVYISKVMAKETINFATSIVLVGGNIGVILTPLIMTKLPQVLQLDVYQVPFYVVTIVMALSSVLSYLALRKQTDF